MHVLDIFKNSLFILVLLHAYSSDAGTVSSFSFVISLDHRVAGKTGAAATFTFTPPSDIGNNHDIIIEYPNNFFKDGVTPLSSLSGSRTCTPTATGATNDQVSCLNVNTKINKNTVVVLTLTGMEMGPVTSGEHKEQILGNVFHSFSLLYPNTTQTHRVSGVLNGVKLKTTADDTWATAHSGQVSRLAFVLFYIHSFSDRAQSLKPHIHNRNERPRCS